MVYPHENVEWFSGKLLIKLNENYSIVGNYYILLAVGVRLDISLKLNVTTLSTKILC